MRYLGQKWDLDSIKDELKADERRGQFEYFYEIEHISVKKLKLEIPNYGKLWLYLYQFFMTGLVIGIVFAWEMVMEAPDDDGQDDEGGL
jgi:hypothetical protein